MFRIAAPVVILALFAPSVLVAESGGPGFVGPGTAYCHEYLLHQSDKHISDLFVTWTQGFLSGMNGGSYLSANKPFVLLTDSDSIRRYLGMYCPENPHHFIAEGAIQIYKELSTLQGNGKFAAPQ